ncbi:cell division transport system permease protein [Methylomarinovum caldicuralii]|uniref:Cell division protein FtsX n=1 Tax=Methylomarinovum caldicuralii TaxID=438856 RepID=A0AAU9C586_9GAMM|nr:permease-like cell division protein FtsX [Methylomarinovum caldicuralii]BCX82395.1 cell division transport system permease protein [Methylomarinovum caldicuralii]
MAGRLKTYLRLHRQALLSSLEELWRAPWMTAVTIGVIAVTLVLPLSFHLILSQVQRLGGAFDSGRQVTLYLQPDLPAKKAQSLAARLREEEAVAQVHLIGKDEALAQLREAGDFAAALDWLPDNPLPAVIEVTPKPAWSEEARLAELIQRWRRWPGVEQIQWNQAWLQRFRAWLRLARHAALALGVILSLAVVLVVGNTVRLELEEHHEAIEVMSLLGATPGFIRRPFLYCGFWFGFLGGGAALAGVFLLYRLLYPHVVELARLYGSRFEAHFFSLGEILGIWLAVCLLTTAAAALVVSRHLWRLFRP